MGQDNDKTSNTMPQDDVSRPAEAVPHWKRSSASRRWLVLGVVVVVMLFILAVLVIAGLAIVVEGLVEQHNQQVADHENQLRGYAPGGMPAAPTILVKPDVPPDTSIKNKLNRTEPIVGLWRSESAYMADYLGPFDNYNLTVYDDHSLIIYDRSNDTYIVGTWTKNTGSPYPDEYTVEEPDHLGPVTANFGGDTIQFQFNDPGSSHPEYINYYLVPSPA